MDNIKMKVDTLEALVEGITDTEVSESKMEEVSEDLLSILSDISTLDGNSDSHKKMLSKIEKCAVAIWNVAVAKKAGGNLSTILNARLRHIACNLVYVSNTTQGEENSLKKQTMMALKTIRAWLDAGNPSMCENPTSMAEDCIKKRAEVVMSQTGGGGDAESAVFTEKRLDVDRDHFKLMCYKAEIAFNMEEFQKSVQFVQQAKDIIPTIPQEGGFLSLLCYNFGVECFEKKQFENCVQFLRDSFELGKGKSTIGPRKQARSLRLLAHAYLEWDSEQHWQKALNAVGLANAESPDPLGLYLKIRIMLVGGEGDERLKMGLFDLLKHPDLNLDLGLNTVKMVIQKDRPQVGFEGLMHLSQRYEHSPPESGRISATHLELLLQVSQTPEAKHLVEQVIVGSNCGQSLDVSVKKRIHLLLWEQAGAAFESHQYQESLEWYNYSLSLYTNQEEQDSNLAKLHRNRASCLLSLGKLDQAEESITKAESCDKTSPFVFYIKYKLAVIRGQDEEAIECLDQMTSCTSDNTKASSDGESTVHGLICLAAQMAFEQSRRSVAVQALERLVEHSPDHQQVLTALRCLIRFRLTIQEEGPTQHSEDLDVLSRYIKAAYEKLILLSESHQEGISSMLHNEATWFMKIAWNMALKSDESYKHMQEFFVFCSKLQMLCGLDSAGLSRHKTCLLMAAAATLQVAKATTDELDKRESLKQCLQFVEDCRAVLIRIQDSAISTTDPSSDHKSPTLLILYEFEAKLMLGDVDVEQVLEKALTLPKVEPDLFENIAALAMEGPRQKKGFASRALKVAIKKHLQVPSVDYTKCSKAFHSLIQLALQSGSQTDSASKEEAWAYYLDLIDIIEQKAQGQYPELEILWLMTKAWNCGIYLYSAANHKDALRWCELSMRLLNHLGGLKANYEKQMTEVYGEILAKMHSSSENIPATSL